MADCRADNEDRRFQVLVGAILSSRAQASVVSRVIQAGSLCDHTVEICLGSWKLLPRMESLMLAATVSTLVACSECMELEANSR